MELQPAANVAIWQQAAAQAPITSAISVNGQRVVNNKRRSFKRDSDEVYLRWSQKSRCTVPKHPKWAFVERLPETLEAIIAMTRTAMIKEVLKKVRLSPAIWPKKIEQQQDQTLQPRELRAVPQCSQPVS